MGEEQQGDFASFYAEHASFLRRALARRGVRACDLDDVVQESFVIAHRLLPDFEGRSSLRTWLTSIAWRTAANYHKRTRRLAVLAMESAPELANLEVPAPAFEPSELPAWTAMDDDLRDLLALHDIGGLSISQLSSLTGLARATVRKRLERSRTRLLRRAEQPTDKLDLQTTFEPTPAQRRAALGPPPPSPPRMLPGNQACIWALDDLVLNVWRGPARADALRAQGEVMEAMVARYPDGFRYLNVIEATSLPPNREGRQMNTELARRFGLKIRAAGFAVESPALRLIVAPILNSSFVLARIPVHIRFFKDVAKATAWLAQYGPTDSEAVLACITAMRAFLDGARPD